MRRVSLVLGILAACGSKGPADRGPAFTPGVAHALDDIAGDCTLTRDGSGEQRSCRGRGGTIRVTVSPERRLRTLEIRLRPTTLVSARLKLEHALRPVLAQAGTAALAAALEKLALGDTATLEAAGATIDLAATGKAPLIPAYAVDLRW